MLSKSASFLGTLCINRGLHVLATLPFRVEENLAPYLSAKTLELVQSLQRNHINRVNQLVQGTNLSSLNLYQLVEHTHRDTNKALIHFHASQAWNVDFWLQGLTNRPQEPIAPLLQALERDFGGFENFQREFAGSAMGILAAGWTWLVKKGNGKLSILNTYDGNSPITVTVKSKNENKYLTSVSGSIGDILGLTSASKGTTETTTEDDGRVVPVLGLNMWEHAYLLDYGIKKGAYIENFWKCINWNRAAVILNIY